MKKTHKIKNGLTFCVKNIKFHNTIIFSFFPVDMLLSQGGRAAFLFSSDSEIAHLNSWAVRALADTQASS